MKKFNYLLIIIFIFITISSVFLTGCDGQSDDSQTPKIVKIPRSTVYDVEKKTLNEEFLSEDGTVLIKISAEYPIFSNPQSLENVDEINLMYEQNATEYIEAVIFDFEEFVQKKYEEDSESFKAYEFSVKCETTYNKNCFISIKRTYFETYEGNDYEYIYADVYDMSVALPVYADEIVTTEDGEDMLKIIYLGFTAVADEFPEHFYENYKDILNSAIKGTEFYLDEEGMVFVLQPGIATYPEYGCLTFKIPYEGNDLYFLKLYEK